MVVEHKVWVEILNSAAVDFNVILHLRIWDIHKVFWRSYYFLRKCYKKVTIIKSDAFVWFTFLDLNNLSLLKSLILTHKKNRSEDSGQNK